MSESTIRSHYKVTKSERAFGKSAQVDLSCEKEATNLDFERLREFDMDWKYGPCIGLTRLERWDRAEKYGLNPPQNIRLLILDHKDEVAYKQCVWNDYHI